MDFELLGQKALQYSSAFDYYLCLKILSMGYKFCRIPKILSIYDLREESIENSNKERSTFESLCAIEEFFPNSPAIKNLHSITRVESPDFYIKYIKYRNENLQ